MASQHPEAYDSIVRIETKESVAGKRIRSASTSNSIFRTISNVTISRQKSKQMYVEAEDDEPMQRNDWAMMPELRGKREQLEKDKFKGRKLGVTWKNLTVKGVGADAAITDNVGSQFIPRKRGSKGSSVTILENSHGCVKPGEMLLVLGRPGAGCTTLLKILANRRQGYQEIDGEVHYGSLDYKEASKFRGQIVINTEDELFFPTLTVAQTMDFATRMKVPFNLPSDTSNPKDFQRQSRDFLLRSMGISHTHDTKVGDEYVRGVSGGERKRVSIIETLASRGSVFCWDNSTRGLDASTALEYTKGVRAMTDIFGLSSIVTLYQAGNGIYKLFDKVLVIDEGKEIFYGPIKEAKPFMEGLGFVCADGANIGDFLTGVTVPTERKISQDHKSDFPRTADAIKSVYEKTEIKQKMEAEYDYPSTETARLNTEDFMQAVKYDKHKSLPASSQLTISFMAQVHACVIRQTQIIWGDKSTLIMKQAVVLFQALISGSLFYNAPNTSAGIFVKGGAMFVSLLFNSLLAMSEVTDSFTGRPILAKHKAFAFYHPAAFCVAQIITDIPILVFQISHFSLVLYFMVGLKQEAGAFFIYWVFLFATAMCMIAFFRACGALFSTFDAATKVSGFLLGVVITYNGYQIPKPAMKPWFGWVFWINPLAYSFEAIMANEFKGQTIPCVLNNLIPNGPGYENRSYQACSGVSGAALGATEVTGEAYLATLSYSASNIWRDFGVVWALWVFFAALTIVATSYWKEQAGKKGYLLIPREKVKKNLGVLNNQASDDEESQRPSGNPPTVSAGSLSEDTKVDDQLIKNTAVFTWKNLTYTVNTPMGERVLLDDVQGFVRPGTLGALMGSSGAGKTTLLDCLAQRKTEGTIKGSIQVDGRPLSLSFQRSAGYCEQLDIHEPLATVREALEFSALLRQGREIPKEEKLKYVDTIINLLEMHDIENTLIGTAGAGLSVEQRKRLTIGVELVAKPKILIFLDEPTSGLDGQSAFNIVRFLRKLADVGQAVLVTIHQPSALLFQQFDQLLLLARGGKTVYFGEIGEQASTVKEYFASHNAPCPKDANPAEHMIDVVSGSLSKDRDWNRVWLESRQYEQVVKDLDHLISSAASREPGTVDDGHEFAVPIWQQIVLVTQRMNVSLWRNTEYVNNKFALHVGSALFNGFSFWMIGNSIADLQLRLFTIFNFLFVAPGVIAQLQPLFIGRRDIYEARERKSKMYHWGAFVTGLIVSEIPYLLICAVLYFFPWYYTVGFPSASSTAGAVLFVMFFYEFIYTGMGQFVAAYAPNATFAAQVNPVVISTLVSFCGVMVPYQQITSFWRYTLYYINPFNYLMGSLMVFTTFNAKVICTEKELAIFNPPSGTCGEYLASYMKGMGSATNLLNPEATAGCKVCQYRSGSDYTTNLALGEYSYGWRDAGIVVLFAFACYGLVYGLMKLRTKKTKTAE